MGGFFFPLSLTDSVIVNGNNMLDQMDFPLWETESNEGYAV